MLTMRSVRAWRLWVLRGRLERTHLVSPTFRYPTLFSLPPFAPSDISMLASVRRWRRLFLLRRLVRLTRTIWVRAVARAALRAWRSDTAAVRADRLAIDVRLPLPRLDVCSRRRLRSASARFGRCGCDEPWRPGGVLSAVPLACARSHRSSPAVRFVLGFTLRVPITFPPMIASSWVLRLRLAGGGVAVACVPGLATLGPQPCPQTIIARARYASLFNHLLRY
jgi:hypothetical protein